MSEIVETDKGEASGALPQWVPRYIDCWGARRPDGRRMTVGFAAGYAGVTTVAVRQLRRRSVAFQRMEWIARHGTAEWVRSYVEAALRNRLAVIFEALDRLLAEAHPETVLTLLGWMRGKPAELKLSGELDILADVWDLRDLSDEELTRLLANLQAAEDDASNTL